MSFLVFDGFFEIVFLGGENPIETHEFLPN